MLSPSAHRREPGGDHLQGPSSIGPRHSSHLAHTALPHESGCRRLCSEMCIPSLSLPTVPHSTLGKGARWGAGGSSYCSSAPSTLQQTHQVQKDVQWGLRKPIQVRYRSPKAPPHTKAACRLAACCGRLERLAAYSLHNSSKPGLAAACASSFSVSRTGRPSNSACVSVPSGIAAPPGLQWRVRAGLQKEGGGGGG